MILVHFRHKTPESARLGEHFSLSKGKDGKVA